MAESGRVGPVRAEWGWGVGQAVGFNEITLRLGPGYKDRRSGAAQAREEVLAELSEKTGTPLASVSQFREHCTATPTVMVKGRACAMAERAQYAVFKSLSPAADGSLILAVKLAQVAHCAYDVSKSTLQMLYWHWGRDSCKRQECLCRPSGHRLR